MNCSVLSGVRRALLLGSVLILLVVLSMSCGGDGGQQARPDSENRAADAPSAAHKTPDKETSPDNGSGDKLSQKASDDGGHASSNGSGGKASSNDDGGQSPSNGSGGQSQSPSSGSAVQGQYKRLPR